MLLVSFNLDGHQRVVNLADLYQGRTCILMGGAPTIKDQPLHLLEQRGVLCAGMNNSAIHFRPQLWFSADHPQAFELQILMDSAITKFAPMGHHDTIVSDKPYHTMPNMLFYICEGDVPMGRMLAPHITTPWYRNTLMSAIVLLYHMGVRRIVLGGSDFEFGGQVYAHPDGLQEHERELNRRLYSAQELDLQKLKPVFDDAKLELLDCSVKSKLGGTYRTVTFEEGVALALEGFPKEMADPRKLPHGTRFAPSNMKKELGIMTELGGVYRIVAASVILLLILLPINFIPVSDTLKLVVGMVAVVAFYPALVGITGALRRKELDILRSVSTGTPAFGPVLNVVLRYMDIFVK